MNKVNCFKEDLEYSHAADELPIWEEVYANAFPGYKACISNRADGQLQRAGIDRTVVLDCGKAVYIDEKVRRVDYNDILLEYISNDRTKSPGWVEKPLMCDYIAYAILPSGKCYLLPVPQLQLAWKRNKVKWIEQFNTKAASNEGYRTISCPVPISVLFSEIGQTLRVSFTPPER